MDAHWRGIGKLIEEIGELQAELVNRPDDVERRALIEEAGDVVAACAYFRETNGIEGGIPDMDVPFVIAAGRLLQLCGKAIAFPIGDHPDGKGPVSDRFSNALATVEKSVRKLLSEIDSPAIEIIHGRIAAKMRRFRDWGLTGVMPSGPDWMDLMTKNCSRDFMIYNSLETRRGYAAAAAELWKRLHESGMPTEEISAQVEEAARRAVADLEPDLLERLGTGFEVDMAILVGVAGEKEAAAYLEGARHRPVRQPA